MTMTTTPTIANVIRTLVPEGLIDECERLSLEVGALMPTVEALVERGRTVRLAIEEVCHQQQIELATLAVGENGYPAAADGWGIIFYALSGYTACDHAFQALTDLAETFDSPQKSDD